MDCPHTMRAKGRDDITRCCDCGMITDPPEAWRDDVECRLRLLASDSHPPIDLTPLVEEILDRRAAEALTATQSPAPSLPADVVALVKATKGLTKLYEDDEGCATLPQYVEAKAALAPFADRAAGETIPVAKGATQVQVAAIIAERDGRDPLEVLKEARAVSVSPPPVAEQIQEDSPSRNTGNHQCGERDGAGLGATAALARGNTCTECGGLFEHLRDGMCGVCFAIDEDNATFDRDLGDDR